ncbi:C6 zinc finger domain protein [Aspergillus sclerotioniger CBS 115572]|uniref:C6 zinc finger domain protein n=1 Tax=Aspergillus sclerotioniger CBS 115572 TaxID=1450535 RepID=A0A317VG48_9EURO|nr:C6 zinc finger domain protein [Aspergillus sclerotioniger CBS 115572]PWY70800.1 C6 zinc finger domain protein [Aspergillus sclerotioniger CBS 115572]
MHSPASESRRRRIKSKRSRAGCRTCRARHIKCDETPGCCRNCTSTGRSCDGYDMHRLPAMSKSLVKLLGASQIAVDIGNGFRWAMTSDERRCFSYFQHHSVPTFCETVDSSLWQRLVLQMAQSDPAVYHAAVALSALHQDSEAKAMPLAADIPAHQDTWPRFAQEQLGRAFQILTRRRASHDPRLRDITLLCCLLFVLSDLLRGQYDGAFAHLQSGLRILQELQAERELVAPTPRQEQVEQCLVAAFAHLDITSAHFGVGAPLLCIDVLPREPHPHPHPHSPIPFHTLRETRDALHLVLSASYRFMVPCMGMSETEIAENYGPILSEQLDIISQITHFWDSFSPFYYTSYPHISHIDQRSAEIIHLQYIGLLVSVKTCTLGRNESALSYFTPELETIVALAESILDRFPKRPTISVDFGIIAPLYHPALSCRDYTVRWRAIKLLRAWPHREGPFDSNWIASLAEEALRLELLSRPGDGLDIGFSLSGLEDDDEFSPKRILTWIHYRHSAYPSQIADSCYMVFGDYKRITEQIPDSHRYHLAEM